MRILVAYIVFEIFITFWVIMTGLWINGELSFDKVFNPITIYKNIDVNIFGCIFLMLLFHIIFLPFAPLYWFYKLCTVRRNK